MKIFLMSPIRALGAVIRATWANFWGYQVLATPEVMEARCEICSQCPFYDVAEMQCLKCGCFVDTKTALNPEKCPLDKWPRVWIKKSLAKEP